MHLDDDRVTNEIDMPQEGPSHGASTERLAHRSANLDRLVPSLVLLVLLLLGFGLRLHRLGNQNIWWDEGHAVLTARQSLVQVTNITAHDVHPPLYLWMLHGWLRLTGETEFAVRYLSLIGGMLTISLTYVIARRTIGRRAALLATLLITAARFHVWWSQEARMYVWAAFWASLSIYFFLRLRQAQSSAWWSYVLSSLAALYTLYLSALVLVVQNLFVLCTVWRQPQRRRFLLNWALGQLAILALYTPWLYLALSYSRTDVAKSPFPLYAVWQLYGTVLATGISTELAQYTWLIVAFGLLALSGVALLLFDRRQPQRYGFAGWEVGLLLFLPLVTPPLVVYGLSIPRGVFYSPKPEARYLLIFAPLVYVLLAGTLTHFWQKGWAGRLVTGIGTLLVVGTFVSVLPAHYAGRYLRDEYQSSMATLGAYEMPGDAALLVSGDRYPVFLYHYNRRFPRGDGPPVYLMPRHSDLFTADSVQLELGPLADLYDRLWLASFERSLQDPGNHVEAWLDGERTVALHVSQDHNYLRLYQQGDGQPVTNGRARVQHMLEPARRLGNSVEVQGYDLPTSEFRPGDVVRPGVYAATRTGSGDSAQPREPSQLIFEWVHRSGQVIERQALSVPLVPQESAFVRLAPSFAVYEYTLPGRYWVDIYAPGDRENRIRIEAGQVTQSRRFPIRKPAVAQTASLGGQIDWLGYTVRTPRKLGAGDTIAVTLFWRANAPVDHNYTVFVHVLGAYNPATGGPLWAQDDSYPLGGGHPTSRWLPDQVVADVHYLAIPEGTPPGSYRIEAGLYDAPTGERLPVDGIDADHLQLGDIEVGAP